MKKWFVIIFLFICTSAFADTFQVDMSGWTQEQKNLTMAMLIMEFHDQRITHGTITVNRQTGEIVVDNPSTGVNAIVTRSAITAIYNPWKVQQDISNAAAQAEEAARETERDTNEIKGLKLNEVDVWIDTRVDAINNMADAKIFLKIVLKKIARYLKAHER